jgi:hypothetical protein
MASSLTPRILALTTLAVAGLLLAPTPQAEAKGRGARTALTVSDTSGPKATPRPIVRDHRRHTQRRCKALGHQHYPHCSSPR